MRNTWNSVLLTDNSKKNPFLGTERKQIQLLSCAPDMVIKQAGLEVRKLWGKLAVKN